MNTSPIQGWAVLVWPFFLGQGNKLNDIEREQLRKLWAAGVKAKDIAYVMNYSLNYINWFVRMNRDICPRRKGKESKYSRKNLMVERVIAGRLTVRQAAEKLGIGTEEMEGYVMEEQARRESHVSE